MRKYCWDRSPHCCLSESLWHQQCASTAAEIYQYIVETPGNYLKYFWGYLNFLDLKTVCQKRLGDDFDLKEFHRRILEIGPVQFPVLEKYMK